MIPAKSNGSARKLSKDPTDEYSFVDVRLSRRVVEGDDGGKKPKSVKTTSSSRRIMSGTMQRTVIPCNDEEIGDVFVDCQQESPLLTNDALGSSRVLSASLHATVDESVHDLRDEMEATSKKVDLLKEKVNSQCQKIKSMETKMDGEPLLPEDTYSFLAITRKDTQNSCCHLGKTFYMGLIVLVFQALTLSLLAVDVVDLENEGNLLDIPAGVSVPVRFAQLIAIVITVISQDEVRLSLNVWYYGYDESIMWNAFCVDDPKNPTDAEGAEPASQDDTVENPGNQYKPDGKFADMMRRRWQMSVLFRFVIGILGLAVAFMLLITVDSVRELLLNFTAVEFVSNVDDAVFLLSKWGYFGGTPKTDAESIADSRWPLAKNDGWFYLCNCRRLRMSIKVEMEEEEEEEEGKKEIGKDVSAQTANEREKKGGSNDVDGDNPEKGGPSNWRIPINTVWMSVIFVAMFFAWLAVVIQQQVRGQYRTNTVYVQFGDEFSPTLATFSGLYTAGRYRGIGKRVDYISSDGSAIFRYCSDDRKWAFLYGENRHNTNFGRHGRCTKNWIRALSSETFTYDLFDTASDRWFFRDNATNREIPMQDFSLSERKKSFGGRCGAKENEGKDEAGEAGFACRIRTWSFGGGCDMKDEDDEEDAFTCERGRWNCKGSMFGESCQYPHQPCTVLEMDQLYPRPFADDRSWSLSYTKAVSKNDSTLLRVYDHPLYIGDEVHHDNVRDVVFFTGRRWVATKTDKIKWLKEKLKNESDKISTEEIMMEYFSNRKFHAHWSEFSVAFVSETVDVNVDSNDPTPVGLRWFNAERKESVVTPIQAPDERQDQKAVLLCAVCSVENSCAFNGTCVDGKCECHGGSEGTLCQIVPTGNGICNREFNTAGYGWDKQDCCPQTCESVDHSCGMNSTLVFGLPVQEYIGYPYCNDPDQLPCKNDKRCWKDLEDLEGAEKGSRAGSFVAISGNGGVVAQLEPGRRTGEQEIRVFVDNGKNWIQRGGTFTNSEAADANASTMSFNSAIALSQDGSILAIAIAGTVQTFYWSLAEEAWNRLGKSHPGMMSVDLSRDGFTLATGSNDGKSVSVHRYTRGDDWYQLGKTIALEEAISRSLSLSGDGTMLALSRGSNLTHAVYKFDEFDEIWKPVGPNLGPNTTIVKLANKTIHNATLSQDGKVLALATYWDVHVFSYQSNNTDSNWKVRGQRIKNVYTRSLSLSGDGSYLVFGATKRQQNITDGVWIYEFDETDNLYNRLDVGRRVTNGDDSGVSVGISHDGSVIAFGAPKYGEENRGITRLVWSKVERTPSDPPGTSTSPSSSRTFRSSKNSSDLMVPITSEVQLDNAPWEMKVDLDCDNESFGSIPWGALPADQGQQKGRGVVRVPKGKVCTFTIMDFTGNGICCSKGEGFYNIYYGDTTENENRLATGGRMFGIRESITFKVDEETPAKLVPISVVMSLNTLFPADTSLNTFSLKCGNVLESISPTGTFRSSSDRRVAEFLLPTDTYCEIMMGFEGEDKHIPNGYYILKARDTLLFEGNGFLDDSRHQFFVPPNSGGCKWNEVSIPPSAMICNDGEKLLRLQLNSSEYGAEVSWNVAAISNVTNSRGTSEAFSEPCRAFASEICIQGDECTIYNLSVTQALPGPSKSVRYQLRVGNETVDSDGHFLGQKIGSVGDACGESKKVRVELFTDKFAEDTSFAIENGIDGTEYYREGPFNKDTDDQRKFQFEYFVPADACLMFVIEDAKGDGICCDEIREGYYKVFLDNEEVLVGGDFLGSEERHQFGNCPEMLPPMSSPPPSESAASAVTYIPTTHLPTMAPTSRECYEDELLVRVELQLDEQPSDTSFVVTSLNSTSDPYLEFGPFNDDDVERLIEVQTCIPVDVCVVFIINDEFDDGICCGENGQGYYKIFLDSELAFEGGEFGSSARHELTSCPDLAEP